MEKSHGNPEPSLNSEEGVETRRLECIVCLSELKGSQRKFCSKKCSARHHSYQWRVNKGLIKKPGVGSGGNQGVDKSHHSYKNGILNYRKRALDHYGKKCNHCGSERYIVVHHIDEDRTNNQLDNLEILCKSCHQEHHINRCPITGKYIKG